MALAGDRNIREKEKAVLFSSPGGKGAQSSEIRTHVFTFYVFFLSSEYFTKEVIEESLLDEIKASMIKRAVLKMQQ